VRLRGQPLQQIRGETRFADARFLLVWATSATVSGASTSPRRRARRSPCANGATVVGANHGRKRSGTRPTAHGPRAAFLHLEKRAGDAHRHRISHPASAGECECMNLRVAPSSQAQKKTRPATARSTCSASRSTSRETSTAAHRRTSAFRIWIPIPRTARRSARRSRRSTSCVQSSNEQLEKLCTSFFSAWCGQ
jgi:hypothetical protein